MHTTYATPLLAALRDRGLTLATAESCTGGMIAHSITLVPGSSDTFVGGIVAYSNAVKIGVLGVAATTLAANGAVSRQVVEQMAVGACRVLAADCAVATSGIAGPGGATPDKPVGTVWIAARTPTTAEARLVHFDGTRAEVIAQAADNALDLLLSLL